MILHMSMNSAQYGPSLYRIVEQEWTRLGLSRTAWCREHNVNDATIYRWSQGSDPGISGARWVAEAVDRPILHVLIEAGALRPEEANVPPLPQPSLDDALRLDPTVSEYGRAIIQEVRKQLRGFGSGESDSTTVDVARRPKRDRKSPGA